MKDDMFGAGLSNQVGSEVTHSTRGTVVTDDDCTTAVTPAPVSKPVMRCEVSFSRMRRSRSPAVLGVALAMTVAWMALGYPGNPVFHILVSLYAVGRYVPDRRISLVALAVALTVVGLGQVTDGDPGSEVVYSLLVTNTGIVADTFDLTPGCKQT